MSLMYIVGFLTAIRFIAEPKMKLIIITKIIKLTDEDTEIALAILIKEYN